MKNNNHQTWIYLGAAFAGVPVAFLILAAATYGAVGRIEGFFPNETYWIAVIIACVASGVLAIVSHRFWSGTKRGLIAVGYVIGMTGALLLLQGIVSCANGDCI